MRGSDRYLEPLAAVRELFVRCPVHVELSSVQIATGADGAATVLVRLGDSDPVVLAAGIVEWRRTLELPGEIDDDVLYRWLGDEIANNWPFAPQQLIESTTSGEPS